MQSTIDGLYKFKIPPKNEENCLRPNGYMMLVRMLEVSQEEVKSESGLIMSIVTDEIKEEVEEHFTIGLVEKQGPLCYTNPKFEGNRYCEEGDYILFGRFQGIDIEFKGVRYKFLQDDRPFATFKEQELVEAGVLVSK